MALDSNALTIGDYAMLSNDPLVQKITVSLIVNGVVFADIPFLNKKTLVANGVRWQDNLPTVTWSKINAGLTVTRGKPTAYQEQAYLMRNAIDVDIKLLEDENRIVDPRVTMLQAYIMSVVYDYNDKFINNDHLTGDDDSFVGLRYRLDNPTTYGVNSEMKINFGGVDLSTSGMTAATANSFIELVQTMLSYMGAEDGTGVYIYCNDNLIRKWEKAIRLLGAGAGWSMTQDAYGRSLMKYRNATIVNIGRKSDQSTRIITNTEDSAGAAGSSTYTSMYAVKYGEEAMVGWQFDPLSESIFDIGMIGNDGTGYRIKIDWANGLLPQHTRCIARGYGIKVA